MSRKQTYYCDTCGTVFCDRPHINLEGIAMRVAHKIGNSWAVKRLKNRYTQYHFCNVICLCEWMTTQTEELFKQIGGEHEGI